MYLARDLSTGAECAVKRMHGGGDPTRSLRREFEALTRVRHPAVVSVLDLASAPDGTPYLVMEYVAGLPANRALARGDWASLYTLGARAAEGLGALHAASVVHGDLKPSNILVVRGADGEEPRDVRLVDFGLSTLRARNDPGARGTPGFAAPEVVSGRSPTAAADLYGLGASLYAIATGAAPFASGRRSEILEQQRVGPPRADALERAGAPRPLIQLILRLLAPAPEERPRDAREARRDIERLRPRSRRPLAQRLNTATLVGRERELARLEQWIALAPAAPRITFVAGDRGSGASALLAELAARATLMERPVVRVSCASHAGRGALARALTRMLAAKAKPAPATAELSTALEPEALLSEPEVGALAATAVKAAGHGSPPILVLLDDADRLDDVSAAWIRRVALSDPPPPILWVIAHPAPESGEEHRVLLESRVAQRIELGPLTEVDVQRLASARLGDQAPPQITSFLWSKASGHPGLTIDVLRGLVERGALIESDHGLIVRPERLANAASPGSFERARLERLAGLGPPAQRLAAALAVCGPALEAEARERLAPGSSEADVERLIAEGLALRDGEGRLVLHPPSLAARVAASLDAAECRELHRAAIELPRRSPRQRFAHWQALGEPGRALAEAEGAFAASPDVELATAAAGIAESLGTEPAGVWHARAAELLRAGGLYAAAIPHLGRALECHADPERRAALWVSLSTATLRSGDARAASGVVDRALEENPSAAVRARLIANRATAHAMLGSQLMAERDAREAVELAAAADDPLGAGMAADAQVRIALERGQIDEAERWADRSGESYRRASHAPGVIRAIGSRALIARARGALDAAERLAREAVEAARGAESRFPLAEQLTKLGAVLVETGQWSGAHAAIAEALRLAIEDGRETDLATALTHIAQIEGLLGQPLAAWRHARTAVRLIARCQPALASYAWRSLAQAERIRGRCGLAALAARRAQRVIVEGAAAEARWCAIEYGRVLASRERWDEAAAVWDGALGDGTRCASIETALLMVLSARAALRRSDLDAAGARRAAAEAWLVHHHLPWAGAHLRLLDAELAFARGWANEGLDHTRAALAAFASLPAPAERARATLDLAQRAPASPEAREAVVPWLDQAVRIFERLGDRSGRERALSLSIEWLRRPAASPAVVRDHGLIERMCWMLSSLTDVDELMRRAMRAAVEQLGAERGVLLLADRETGQLVPTVEYGAVEPVTRDEALGYSRRVVQHVTRGGDSLLIVDADSDPRAASDSVADMRLRSILCVPLFVDGRAVGAVYLDDSRCTHAFAEADRGMIEGFAHLMAVAIEKSWRHEEVRQQNERLAGENLSLRHEATARTRTHGMIGSSAAMQRVLGLVEHASRTDTTVLITGENGTGKELIARTLHSEGKRAMGPFIAVNCGALPDSLIESELFGILGNVATGVRARAGKFVLANGGTLFLDEVGDMPLAQQVVLLSAIASREVTPIGANRPIPIDVRVIAATNRDLRRQVELGQFREDLYYRLNVIEIEVPALRERKADIPFLARQFLEQFSRQQNREAPKLSTDFFAVLTRSDWPGNVRELQNYIERLLAITPAPYMRPDPPPRDVESSLARRTPHRRKLMDAVAEVERRTILEALERAGGNQTRAARDLGLTEQSVRYRLRKYGLTSRRRRRIRRN